MNATQLDLFMSPREFFHGKIKDASRHLNVKLDDHVEFYLVDLLTKFVTTDNIKGDGVESDDMLSTPLAFMLKRAVEASSEKQPQLYRRLGDTSLYLSGFFQDYFNRKPFDIGYYINMGAAAYEQASNLTRSQTREDGLPETLDALSRNFTRVVDVVAQASDSTALHHDSSLLVLYDRWNRSGSERLREMLQEKGINPIHVPNKLAQ
jgi:hypothetical protein